MLTIPFLSDLMFFLSLVENVGKLFLKLTGKISYSGVTTQGDILPSGIYQYILTNHTINCGYFIDV